MMTEYYKLNILEIQELFDESLLDSETLCQYYLDRIKKYNKHTNSIRCINPNALDIAMRMDEELKNNHKRSLLHGIPILIKDNINTLDKMKTTAGSIALKDFYASSDAFIVKQLRKAGAVILGKTNLSEFANFVSWDSKNGFSTLGGQVINPYAEELDVGGSSSGSGAAMATSLAQIAIGTETSGSILSPSLRNSVVGVKPTVGMISRNGIIPISPSQDIPGPMTRNVVDAAILLNEMIGFDKVDVSTHNDFVKEKININNVMNLDALKGARLGYVKGHLSETSLEERKVMDKAVSKMKNFGAEIIEINTIAPNEEVSYDVLFYEFPIALKEYFQNEVNAPFNSLDELMEYNLKDPANRIPFGQGVFDKCQKLNISETEYKALRVRDLELANELNKFIQDNDLDALLFTGYYGTARAAKGGYPSVMVPSGYTEQNHPLSVTFSSIKFTEEKLLALAYSFEQLTKARIDPVLND